MSPKPPASPLFHATTIACAVPLCALAVIFCGVFLLVLWPLLPLFAYGQRKREIAEWNESHRMFEKCRSEMLGTLFAKPPHQ